MIKAGKYRSTNRESDQSGCQYPPRGGRGICPVCYLLGAQGLTGFVSVPFLTAEHTADELYSGRLSRATGTIAHSTNRPYELVREGTNFRGEMTILEQDTLRGWTLGEPRILSSEPSPDQWLISGERKLDWILTELVENRLRAIGAIGGYRSKGFGQIKVSVKEKGT